MWKWIAILDVQELSCMWVCVTSHPKMITKSIYLSGVCLVEWVIEDVLHTHSLHTYHSSKIVIPCMPKSLQPSTCLYCNLLSWKSYCPFKYILALGASAFTIYMSSFTNHTLCMWKVHPHYYSKRVFCCVKV